MSPPETTVHGTKHTEQEALMAALQANQALLEERLQGEKGLYEVRRLREEVRAGVPWIYTDTEDVTWSFVQECLLLLLSLARNLTLQLELFNQAPSPAMSRLRTPESTGLTRVLVQNSWLLGAPGWDRVSGSSPGPTSYR